MTANELLPLAVLASSLLPGYAIHAVAHLNDGLFGNDHNWIAATTGEEWVEIELPSPAPINRVVLSRDRNGQFKDRQILEAEVRLSVDGKSWQTAGVLKRSANQLPRSGPQLTFPVAELTEPSWAGAVAYAFLRERERWSRMDAKDYLSPLVNDRPASPGGQPYWGRLSRFTPLEGTLVQFEEMISHGHFLVVGFARLNVDLVGARSLQEVLDRVAVAVRSAKPGEWIVGRGWHEGKWTDTSTLTVRGFPTHHALTKVAPDNPVYLTRADGHAAFTNARAMELAGITKDTRSPEGGDVIKEEAGAPTGIFVDRAMGLVRVPGPSPDQTRRALDLAIEECLAKGVTAFDDAGVGLDAVGLYKEYAANGRLPLRLYVLLRGPPACMRGMPPCVELLVHDMAIRASTWVIG